jgi:putative AbiEi antitoxin of type IV toxin-antitoxin system/uncharacterized protein DUF559
MNQLLANAATQFGLFTRRQAHACGLTDRMLQYRVQNGLFEQVGRHVYRVCGSESTWHQRLLAACLVGGDKCLASHRSAAELHGFDAVRRGIIEVTVPRGTRVRNLDAIVHESLDLAADDYMHVGPIPVTSPARTLIDLGAVSRWERVEEAFDGVERDNLTEPYSVKRRHAQVRRQGRNGVGPMAVVLRKRLRVPPKYVIERRFVRLLENAGLPIPELQYEVKLSNGREVYIDAAHTAPKLAWELDGHGAHATRKQRAADNRRASALSDLGWTVRRFTYEQVMDEGDAVVRAVRAALRSRSCDI